MGIIRCGFGLFSFSTKTIRSRTVKEIAVKKPLSGNYLEAKPALKAKA
jgi:hypothetical protein